MLPKMHRLGNANRMLGLELSITATDFVYIIINIVKFRQRSQVMAEETLFSKIIRREIPADILYQDDLVTAFRDIQPKAPTHVLIIPNHLIPTANDVKASDELALGRMITVAAKLAAEAGIAKDGYRLIMNCNQHGGQEVYHIHMHLVGGKSLGPMLSV
jgi:histidine triad (HIT) family protein